MEKSNVTVKSNLMLKSLLKQGEPHYRYMPGDLVFQMYKAYGLPTLSGSQLQIVLNPMQLVEYRQKIVCMRCHRPCAGTCGG
jgi:hypothetical protein